MRRMEAVLLLAGISLLLMGCAAPQPAFYNCCLYENASNDGVCVTMNGTVYETKSCDTSPGGNFTCEVITGQRFMVATIGTRQVTIPVDETDTLPVCPRNELLRCNSSCVGMFCGSFEFDPRPPVGAEAEALNESSSGDKFDAGAYGGVDKGGAKGLYKGECRMLNMSPATIRAAGNTKGGFALNAFRFGVGNSFAEFDEALMYYPLTDLACGANTLGTVDRYENYYMPNMMGSSGAKLCEKIIPGELEIPQYVCTLDGEIRSYSYQDCAVRCVLAYYGDVPAVEPYNAYLTERNGKVAGNPFAYGGPGQGYDVKERSAVRYNWDKYYKWYPGYTNFVDEYPGGLTYYGANFEGKEDLNDENGGIDRIMIDYGQAEEEEKEIMDYYAGEESSLRVLEWPGVVENLITVEKDPHLLYSYMLSHHSVYSRQFTEGHYTVKGEWKPGAEFECSLEGAECISGFCNTEDYKRGVCFRVPDYGSGGLKEVPCGCYYDYMEATTVCPGMKPVEVKAFDNPTERISSTATLGAIIKSVETGDYVSLPSKGKVITYDVGEVLGLEDRIGQKQVMLVVALGGEQYPTFSEFRYQDGVDDMNETLTLPQALSTKQWAGCRDYGDCGKFYTTIVDACVPEVNRDDYYNTLVCYRNNIEGSNGWALWPEGGSFGAHPMDHPICWQLQEADGRNIDGNENTNYDVYCYARNADGRCTGVAQSALVLVGHEITYTNEDGEETTATAFGNCILDGDMLRTKTYGYCEQCSYLTMAKEEVVQLPENDEDPGYEGEESREGNNYCPSLAMRTITPQTESMLSWSYNGQFGEWESGGVQDEKCYMPDGTQLGFQGGWPDYLPNAYYLKKKIGDYLQRNIMPVIFAEYPDPAGSNEGLYYGGTPPDVYFYIARDETYWSQQFMKDLFEKNRYSFEKNADAETGYLYTGGAFLADSVMDQGAAIIVIKRLNSSDWRREGEATRWISIPGGPMVEIGNDVDYMVYTAGRRVNALCPNCMVAVGIGYGDEGSGYETRMSQASHLFGYKNATSGEQLWDYGNYPINASCFDEGMECNYRNLERIDLLAVKWELGGRNSHCNIVEDEQERFNAILNDEMEFGTKMLRRFGKPIVVTDFSIRRNYGGFEECWNDGSAKRFMEFLGAHTEDLVRSGHIGLIYSDWTYGHSGRAGTTAIRTKEEVEGNRGPFFEGTFLAARDFTGFGKMETVVEVPVMDECTCVPCSSTDPAEICNGRFGGDGPECAWPGPRIMVKWPEDCITESVCIGMDEMPFYRLECKIVQNGELVEIPPIEGAEIAANPDFYTQMIASIKGSSRVPCISNKTYSKREITSFLSHPILFRKDGNLNYSCNALSIAQGSFCGPVQQLDIGSMECELKRNIIIR